MHIPGRAPFSLTRDRLEDATMCRSSVEARRLDVTGNTVKPAESSLESSINSHPYSEATRSIDQRWSEITGASAQSAALLICVPVRNEAKGIKGFLQELQHLTLPYAGVAQVLIITNGCTDGTPALVDQHSAQLAGREGWKSLSMSVLDVGAHGIEKHGLRVLHVPREELGKAAALNFANRAAIAGGFPLVVSIDADVRLRSDAVAQLYRHLYPSGQDAKLPDFISGKIDFSYERRGSEPCSLLTRFLSPLSAGNNVGTCCKIAGPLFAWRPEFLQKIGGVPRVALEDVALSLLAERFGARVVQADAYATCRPSSNLRDCWSYLCRLYRGIEEIKAAYAQDSAVLELLARDTESRPSELSPAVIARAAVGWCARLCGPSTPTGSWETRFSTKG